MSVLSTSGEPIGAVSTQHGNPFARAELGPLCFHGDELAVAAGNGLVFCRLEPIP